MKVEIERYRPDTGEKRKDCFEVPVTNDRRMTVMDLLDYISLNLDGSLSYYKHSACNHGICGRCSLQVNGKTRLACLTVVNDYDTLTLSPANGRKVIKDLVTKL
ncbi:MAG: 2Fe-2S iron-sulfur cluster-binding protein [Acetivibrionales bacterium]|jgi:succinate dehydrogenase / fumarate reductase iron-sulfur subunit